MKGRRLRPTLLLLVLLIPAAAAVGQKTERRPAPPPKAAGTVVPSDPVEFLGSLTGQVYTNKYFGFSITVPAGYTILNRDEIAVYTKAGLDMLKGEQESSRRAFDAATKGTSNLLAVSKLQPGSPGNAAFELSVARQSPGVTANMVIAETSKVMASGGKSRLSAALGEKIFGGRRFVGAEFETDAGGQKLIQRVFVTMHRGHAFSFGLTYTSPESMSAFDEMLETVTFTAR